MVRSNSRVSPVDRSASYAIRDDARGSMLVHGLRCARSRRCHSLNEVGTATRSDLFPLACRLDRVGVSQHFKYLERASNNCVTELGFRKRSLELVV